MPEFFKSLQNATHAIPDTSAGTQVCQIRTELLDRLASAVEELGRAKLDLITNLENDGFKRALLATGRVEQLRNDCGIVRAELECHRASHGC